MLRTLLFLVAVSASCSSHGGRKYGDVLTADDILAQLSVEPQPVRELFNSSLAERQRYVEHLLRSRALAAEARRRGLDKDPLVQRRMERVLVDGLLEKLRDETRPESVSEAEVDAYLARHGAAMAPRKRTRASQLVLASRGEAEQVRESLLKVPAALREARFREEARARSLDRPSAERAGDAGYLGQGMLGVPDVLGRAADALAGLGDLSPPVEHGGRFVLLLKTGELVPPTLPAEIARRQARSSLLEERRRQAIDAIVASTKQGIDREVLAKLRAPAGPGPTARR